MRQAGQAPVAGPRSQTVCGNSSAQQPCPGKKSVIGAWRDPATSDRQRPQGNRGHPIMRDVQADRLERMNRFVKRMNEVERDLTAPYVRPKDAATLILVDRSGPPPKVLLGKRHHGTNSCRESSFSPAAGWIPSTGSCRWRKRWIAMPKPPDEQLQRASAAKARAFALPPSARRSRRPDFCSGCGSTKR